MWPSPLLPARMSANSILPLCAGCRSTWITSPGATRYCLPPARITAYIFHILRLSLFEIAGRSAEGAQAPREGSALEANLVILALNVDVRQIGLKIIIPFAG